MNLKSLPPAAWYTAGALVGGLVLLYLARRGAVAVAKAVNPVDPNNVFATGTNAVGAALSGNDSWNLGGWLYDLTHRDPIKKGEAAAVRAYTPPPTLTR